MTGPGCISAGVIGPLRPRDIINVVKRAGIQWGGQRGSVGDEREGGGVRWSSILRLWESTLPQGSFDRNSKLDI